MANFLGDVGLIFCPTISAILCGTKVFVGQVVGQRMYVCGTKGKGDEEVSEVWVAGE